MIPVIVKYRNNVLRDARLVKGLTQIELAAATGLSPGAINMVEMGKGPWLKAIRTICNTLDLSLPEVIIISDSNGNGSKRKSKERAGAGK